MLRFALTHPALLAALGRSGHGTRVLLSDGNYPHRTGTARDAEIIHLNLAPGLLTVTQVLPPLLSAIAVESAAVMDPGTDRPDPDCFAQYERLLGGMALERLERHAFYETARGRDVGVVIATGDTAHFANLLLTIAALPS